MTRITRPLPSDAFQQHLRFVTRLRPEIRVQLPVREARLKPEFAHLYPGLQPGVWMSASVLGQQLLLWHLTAPTPPQGERLLAEEHFDFRGGQKRVGSWTVKRTRLADG